MRHPSGQSEGYAQGHHCQEVTRDLSFLRRHHKEMPTVDCRPYRPPVFDLPQVGTLSVRLQSTIAAMRPMRRLPPVRPPPSTRRKMSRFKMHTLRPLLCKLQRSARGFQHCLPVLQSTLLSWRPSTAPETTSPTTHPHRMRCQNISNQDPLFTSIKATT